MRHRSYTLLLYTYFIKYQSDSAIVNIIISWNIIATRFVSKHISFIIRFNYAFLVTTTWKTHYTILSPILNKHPWNIKKISFIFYRLLSSWSSSSGSSVQKIRKQYMKKVASHSWIINGNAINIFVFIPLMNETLSEKIIFLFLITFPGYL